MKKLLEHIQITPSKNGGHTVNHVFKRAPVSRKGAALGGLGFDAPPAEEHAFGANEGKKMLAHVASTLGIPIAGAMGQQPQAQPQEK